MFFLLLFSFILFKLVNSEDVSITVHNILRPFIWAFAIAFFLNVLLAKIEKKFKLKRWLNILIVYIIFFGIITLFVLFITPMVVNSIKNLGKELPEYIDITQEWLEGLPNKFHGKTEYYYIVEEIKSALESLMVKAKESIGPLLNKTITQIINLTSGIFNFIMGAIISVYILKDKEQFVNGFRRITYAMFSNETAETLGIVQREINGAFSKFFVGKIIDSAIIGILCLIGLWIMKVPYALLISLIVGITNMIPYFGPFIGMIPAAVITLFDRPIKALWVVIFIFLLQQFDGLYLGPKILGIQVGMKPFWIITAILIGGGFFGVWGMLFAVPVAAVVRSLIDRYTKKQLQTKGIKY
ncbi:AI-2E family transporter [Anaerosalibacter sp. Marseille-P3206]|uniref:AI-2E family transporter n=1 Tax=Anaerosalibacter sp. Marseille-P3206 TaxID=1871005 RepID=UPI002101CE61|nr:AI-2E family transporter [Anaerosalibacter sp. Marseille-P3206]